MQILQGALLVDGQAPLEPERKQIRARLTTQRGEWSCFHGSNYRQQASTVVSDRQSAFRTVLILGINGGFRVAKNWETCIGYCQERTHRALATTSASSQHYECYYVATMRHSAALSDAGLDSSARPCCRGKHAWRLRKKGRILYAVEVASRPAFLTAILRKATDVQTFLETVIGFRHLVGGWERRGAGCIDLYGFT